jgi:hypothetical protein
MINKKMRGIVQNLIQVAEKYDMGDFFYEDTQKGGYVYELNTKTFYSVGDFVDYVMNERLRIFTMLER